MILENKLGLTDAATLAREEERISKLRAMELFESDELSSMPAGAFSTLARIHERLFSDVYPFAGQLRTVNIPSNNTRYSCGFCKKYRKIVKKLLTQLAFCDRMALPVKIGFY